MVNRYDKNIKIGIHYLNDLVMLHQKNKLGKLQPRWKSPFKMVKYGGTHGRNFILKQFNGRKIKNTFRGDCWGLV